MPAKGDWKKPFAAAQEMVRNSLKGSAYLLMDQIRKLVAEDIILGGTKVVTNRSGKRKMAYIRVPGKTNVISFSEKMKKPRIIFNNTKFLNRSGNLLEQLKTTPITVKEYEGGATASLKLNEKAFHSLTQKKNSRTDVQITDKAGKAKDAQVRRRPFELARNKVFGAWKSNLKKMLDDGARKIK